MDELFKAISNWIDGLDSTTKIIICGLLLLWAIFSVIQYFLSFGTAYRSAKWGRDTGVSLFIYLIGYGFASLVPGLGLYHYIRHLAPRQVIVQQNVGPQIVRVNQPVEQQVQVPVAKIKTKKVPITEVNPASLTPEQMQQLQQYQQYQQMLQLQQMQQMQQQQSQMPSANQGQFVKPQESEKKLTREEFIEQQRQAYANQRNEAANEAQEMR